MIGIFSLLLILAGIGIIGSAIWIWKSKTNWSTLKKIVITVLIAAGLIAAVFASFIALLAGYQEGADRGMWIEEVNKPLNKFEYAEITEAELEESPALQRAVSIEGRSLGMNGTEWEQTQKFLDKKWRERSNLFVIDEKYLEEELNKSIITVKMRNIFASEGYPVPEKSYMKRDGDRWYVMKIYSLFSITDSEVEKELNRINITAGKDAGDIVPLKLKNVFRSSGFSLPEDARISRDDRGWIIRAGTGYTTPKEEGRLNAKGADSSQVFNINGYTILKEEVKLNVYTGDEKTHEILRENGKLKVVYVGPQGSPIFKIREKYYRFEFWVS